MLNVYIFDSKCLTDEDLDTLIASLPFGESERSRLLSIKNPVRKRESLGALLCLKKLLSVHAIAPADISRTALGKPYFIGDCAPSFSLTHTDGICAAVISDDRKNVGIDIERTDKDINVEQMSKRFFTYDELCALKESDSTPFAFLRIWTQKEARAKLWGDSIYNVKDEDKTIYTYSKKLELERGYIIMSVAYSEETMINYIIGKDIYELQN